MFNFLVPMLAPPKSKNKNIAVLQPPNTPIYVSYKKKHTQNKIYIDVQINTPFSITQYTKLRWLRVLYAYNSYLIS